MTAPEANFQPMVRKKTTDLLELVAVLFEEKVMSIFKVAGIKGYSGCWEQYQMLSMEYKKEVRWVKRRFRENFCSDILREQEAAIYFVRSWPRNLSTLRASVKETDWLIHNKPKYNYV